jgi:hypothetical protein
VNVRTAITRIAFTACFLAPLVWIFADAIFTSRLFVFRDAAHYYHPLFQWCAREWGEGRIPLWNPYENSGTPTIADPTASVFYPGKLLFALPLEFGTRYKIYILSHVLMAGGVAFLVARRWNASPAAATACGMSYAFGGSIVFQYCNVVYLVGAAWLPLAFYTADGLLRQRRWTWVVGLGSVLAMMVLGGDPQTAYHAGLIALLGLFLRRRRISRTDKQPACRLPLRKRGLSFGRRALLLACAGLMAALFAAVQIIPSAHWTRRSERAVFDTPRRLAEIPEWLARSPTDGASERTLGAGLQSVIAPPAPGTHHEHIFQFSIAPWRWAEFFWPNFSGRSFPVHRRWIQAIPAEGRLWTPSLYVGLAPIIAALAAWRVRGGPFRTQWLSWTALLALLAALGWYGLGWLWLELQHTMGHDVAAESNIGAPTGGLYWLLVNVLPGYVYFRYPAKWLTIASLAISLLAARGWDATFLQRSNKAKRLLIAVGLLSLAGVAAAVAVRPLWNTWMSVVPPDDLFGPLDRDGAWRDLFFSFVHAAVLCGCLLAVMRFKVAGTLRVPSAARLSRVQSADGTRSVPATFVMFITAFDLAVAQGWMVPTAPAEIWKRSSAAAITIRRDAKQIANAEIRVFRASQARWLPPQWAQSSSPQRNVEGLIWDHASLYPKHNLLAELPLVESSGSMAAADYAALFKVAREQGPRRGDGIREPAPQVLNLLAANYAVLPRDARLRGGNVLAPDWEGDLWNVAVWRSGSDLARAWIADRVVQFPELQEQSPSALAQRTRDVLFDKGRWRDFRPTAVIEISTTDLELTPSADPTVLNQCRIVACQPQRVDIDVELSRPGLLVLADFYDDDWQASYVPGNDGGPRPIQMVRTNRVQRGVWLPAGSGRVIFGYRPTGFYVGAGISAFAWLGLLIWIVCIEKAAFIRHFARSH